MATPSPTAASHAPPAVGYIPSLDGIRACSFLIVFAAHAGLERWVPGMFGLSVFFFLSGYLITTLLRVEWERTGTVDLPQFYRRRALRILPPFYVVLAAASVLTLLGVLDGALAKNAVLMQALQLGNYEIVRSGWWDGRAPGTWVLWSLAVEEHFYFVFPLLYLALRRHRLSGRHQAYVLGALCALVLVWRCVLVWGFNVPGDRVYVATDTRIDGIVWGCMLAVYGNPVLDRSKVSDRTLVWGWLPLGILLLAASFAVRQPWWDHTLRYTLQGIGLIPLFAIAIRYHNRPVVRWLNARRLRRIGVLSYGLYLVHTPVIYGVQQWTDWHPFVQSGLAFVLTYGLAVCLHRYVEQPSARLRKRIEQRHQTHGAHGNHAPAAHAVGSDADALAPAHG